jgi:hypothetical protein
LWLLLLLPGSLPLLLRDPLLLHRPRLLLPGPLLRGLLLPLLLG